jgi:hypothetical protein
VRPSRGHSKPQKIVRLELTDLDLVLTLDKVVTTNFVTTIAYWKDVLVNVKSLPCLQSLPKNPPSSMPHDLPMFKFIITFSLVSKPQKGRRTFPKYWAELYFHLLLGPLF